MRLWHEKLILYLPKDQLLGQNRECCGLRGNGWGRKHRDVNYVFRYSPMYLIKYHYSIMQEMIRRTYEVRNEKWWELNYRGLKCKPYTKKEMHIIEMCLPKLKHREQQGLNIYEEHDNTYLQECLDNLAGKGVIINFEEGKI